jgi:hypothetical protein
MVRAWAAAPMARAAVTRTDCNIWGGGKMMGRSERTMRLLYSPITIRKLMM